MGIGVSIVLLVIGLVLVTESVSLPQSVHDVIATSTVGWICVGVAVLGLVLALVTARRGTHTTHVEERRLDA